MRKSPRKNQGFTLVEMIISIMIFAIVAVVALGALVKIISTNRKAQTLQSSITNLNFAVEALSRELRVGSTYDCAILSGSFDPTNMTATACDKGDDLQKMIVFKSGSAGTYSTDSTRTCSLAHAYLFTQRDPDYTGKTILERAEQNYCDDQFTQSSFSPVIDPNITISDFDLQVSNSAYPLAYIHLTGFAGDSAKEKEKSYFDLETALSPRIP